MTTEDVVDNLLDPEEDESLDSLLEQGTFTERRHSVVPSSRSTLPYLEAKRQVNGQVTRSSLFVWSSVIRRECTRQGVSAEERDALLAIAQHPFASEWARERYGR